MGKRWVKDARKKGAAEIKVRIFQNLIQRNKPGS